LDKAAMSDNYLKLAPVDVEFVPALAAQRAAVALLQQLVPGADEVRAAVRDEVEFIDCGSNWSGVRCPRCRAGLDEWWPEAMASAASTAFAALGVTTPCCELKVAMSELDYVWPVHFGRFVLQARNAGAEQLPSADLRQLEALLGCPLRVVFAHY
jgi:hypothetical protein